MSNRLGVIGLAAVLVMFVSGCVSVEPLKIDRGIEVSEHLTGKNVVLVNHTQFDLDVRRALTKVGFNVKKFATTKESQMPYQGGTVTFNEADARYGISQYPGRVVDYCLGIAGSTGNVKFKEFSFEVADLSTNNVVLTISKGGWINGCGVESGNLFDELASALRLNWK
jgi:hypothetical protein